MVKLLISFMTVTVLLFVTPPVFAHQQIPSKKCIPFAAKEVPNETSLHPVKWVFYDSTVYDASSIYTYPNCNQVWFEVIRYYKDVLDTGLHLSIHEFFGQLAFKAWSCDVGEDPITKNKPDHMVAVLKDGKWYVANVQSPEIEEVYGKDDLLDYVKVTLRDKNGKTIVERTIKP